MAGERGAGSFSAAGKCRCSAIGSGSEGKVFPENDGKRAFSTLREKNSHLHRHKRHGGMSK